jgi:hypothetical protein
MGIRISYADVLTAAVRIRSGCDGRGRPRQFRKVVSRLRRPRRRPRKRGEQGLGLAFRVLARGPLSLFKREADHEAECVGKFAKLVLAMQFAVLKRPTGQALQSDLHFVSRSS